MVVGRRVGGRGGRIGAGPLGGQRGSDGDGRGRFGFRNRGGDGGSGCECGDRVARDPGVLRLGRYAASGRGGRGCERLSRGGERGCVVVARCVGGDGRRVGAGELGGERGSDGGGRGGFGLRKRRGDGGSGCECGERVARDPGVLRPGRYAASGRGGRGCERLSRGGERGCVVVARCVGGDGRRVGAGELGGERGSDGGGGGRFGLRKRRGCRGPG